MNEGEGRPSRHLYLKCPACEGEGEIAPPESGGTPEMGVAACPGCGGGGYIRIGLTLGQLDRLMAAGRERNRCSASSASTC
jgi:pyruvate/2-oxoacid:ferredoxin oxidoreductase beta subunit